MTTEKYDYLKELFTDEAKGTLNKKGGGGGGVSSWNDLTDRPFYSEMVEGVPVYDGDLTKEEVYDFQGVMNLIRKSDTPLTMEQLIGSTVIIKINAPMLGIDSDTIIEHTLTEADAQLIDIDADNYAIVVQPQDIGVPACLIVRGDTSALFEANIPEGVYYTHMPEQSLGAIGTYCYTYSMSCLYGVWEDLKTIDEKYLPDSSIIDVAELPTGRDIDTKVIYRLTKNAYLYTVDDTNGDFGINTSTIIHCVEELPEIGEPYEEDTNNVIKHYVLYYDIKMGSVHGYFGDGVWNTFIIGGVYQRIDFEELCSKDLIRRETKYVLLDSELYIYNQDWIKISPNVISGSSYGSVIMSDYNNRASGLYATATGGCEFINWADYYFSLEPTENPLVYSYADDDRIDMIVPEMQILRCADDVQFVKVVEVDKENKTVTLDKELYTKRVTTTQFRWGIASGDYSHVEGWNNVASADYSHAEGCLSHAEGWYSHAEGRENYASGNASHVEGEDNVASGHGSHAEGANNVASGDYAHVEGYKTIASGDESHAEGYNTIASGNYQHVQGKHNIPDETSAHIVGNGGGNTIYDLSNAHTLDWYGNAWFAGNVYVGSTSGTNKDEGSKKLVTEDKVTAMIEAAMLVDETEEV